MPYTTTARTARRSGKDTTCTSATTARAAHGVAIQQQAETRTIRLQVRPAASTTPGSVSAYLSYAIYVPRHLSLTAGSYSSWTLSEYEVYYAA